MATTSVASPPFPTVTRNTPAPPNPISRTTQNAQPITTTSSTSTSSTSTSLTSSSSSTSSSNPPQTTSSPPSQSTANNRPSSTTQSTQPTSGNGSPAPRSKVSVAAPIGAIIGLIIVIYIAYKLYQRRWRRKHQTQTPLPPPRVPAVLDRNSKAMSGYYGGGRPQSMAALPYAAPVSMVHSDSSFPSDIENLKQVMSPTGLSASATEHSTPSVNEEKPAPFSGPIPRRKPPITVQTRPISVVSTASRLSLYSNAPNGRSSSTPIRGAPHQPHNRIEIVLPTPLSGQTQQPQGQRPYSNYAVAKQGSLPDLRSTSNEYTESWVSERAASMDRHSYSGSDHGQYYRGGPDPNAPPVPPLPASINRMASPPPNQWGGANTYPRGAPYGQWAVPRGPPPPMQPTEVPLEALPAVRLSLYQDTPPSPPPKAISPPANRTTHQQKQKSA